MNTKAIYFVKAKRQIAEFHGRVTFIKALQYAFGKYTLSETDLLLYFILIQDIEGPTTLDIGRMPVVTYATRHRG